MGVEDLLEIIFHVDWVSCSRLARASNNFRQRFRDFVDQKVVGMEGQLVLGPCAEANDGDIAELLVCVRSTVVQLIIRGLPLLTMRGLSPIMGEGGRVRCICVEDCPCLSVPDLAGLALKYRLGASSPTIERWVGGQPLRCEGCDHGVVVGPASCSAGCGLDLCTWCVPKFASVRPYTSMEWICTPCWMDLDGEAKSLWITYRPGDRNVVYTASSSLMFQQ